MSPELALTELRRGLEVALWVGGPLLVAVLVVGVVVGVVQAATQINEQTLSFLPRLLVMLITLIVAGPWLVQKFMEYITTLYTNIPQLIG